MKLRCSIDAAKTLPDITPLVDVVLLLLIFFLLTSSFVFQPGIKIDPPQANIPGGVNSRHIISISSQDPPLIFFNDQLADMNSLSEKLNRLARRQPNATVVIKADRTVPHGLVARVMNLSLNAGLPILIATQPEMPLPSEKSQ